MHTKFFFDFDDVLVNTRRICEDYFSLFTNVGISSKEGEALYQKTKTEAGRDDPHVFARLLHERAPDMPEEEFLHRLLQFKRRSAKYVFSDSEMFLKKLQSIGCEMYVVSTGDQEGQRTKIGGSGLEEYFKEIVIVGADKEKPGAIASRCGEGEQCVFFDDKATVTEHVKQELPRFFVVQMRRHDDIKEAEGIDGGVHDFQSFIDTYPQLLK